MLAKQCRFTDCTHIAEPGCAIQTAIKKDQIDADRVARWRKLVLEEAHTTEKASLKDALAISRQASFTRA